LNAAIDAAADGDTLILRAGTYSCSNPATNPFLVNKSLTIRANTNDADAMISCPFTIAGVDVAAPLRALDRRNNFHLHQAPNVGVMQGALFAKSIPI
jgi:hypothetical protein